MSHTHRHKPPASSSAPAKIITLLPPLPEPTALDLLFNRIMTDDDLEEAERNSYALLQATPNVKHAIFATCETFGIMPENFKEAERSRALSGLLQLVNIGFMAGTSVGFLAGLEFEPADDGGDDDEYTGI